MKIIRWARERRVVGAMGSAAFFDLPLRRLTLFSFTTCSFSIPEHGGALSLKVVFEGQEWYRLGRKQMLLRPGHALIINAGERYASAIEGPRTEALSLFIPDDEAAAIARWLVEDDEALLEAPLANAWRVGFVQAPLRQMASFRARANALRWGLDDDPELVGECARKLIAEGFAANLGAAPPGALRGLRAPVRDEVIVRLLRARDWMHEQQGVGCTLSALSARACMSSYHFLRRFAEAYGMTPAAYARTLRLARAERALARGASRAEAARQAGYSSYDALARVMRRARRRD